MNAPNRPDPNDIRSPVTILTGFLGSGKTTLLNRALSSPDLQKTAVIINEFGDISIDHALTTSSDDTIMVLENGCLCCTVFGDLVQTMNRLYHARAAGEIAFDQVLIETSGLAEVGPILQAFLSEPTLEGLFQVGAVIATVDAVNAAATLRDHAVSIRQIALADAIIMTKLDLVAPDLRDASEQGLQAQLRKSNPHALIWNSSDPAADPVRFMSHRVANPAFGPEAARAWLTAEIDHPKAAIETGHDHDHHDHESDISSFTLVQDDPLTRDALSFLLSSLERHLGPSLLRVKGLVNVIEEPGRPAVIQGAQHLLHNLSWLDRWPDDDHRTRVVFITQGLPPGELEELVGLLDRIAQRTAKARLQAGLHS